eukprot:IDg13292t1
MYPPRPIAIQPAASSATTPVRTRRESDVVLASPAARAKGTVDPSLAPSTMFAIRADAPLLDGFAHSRIVKRHGHGGCWEMRVLGDAEMRCVACKIYGRVLGLRKRAMGSRSAHSASCRLLHDVGTEFGERARSGPAAGPGEGPVQCACARSGGRYRGGHGGEVVFADAGAGEMDGYVKVRSTGRSGPRLVARAATSIGKAGANSRQGRGSEAS